MSLPRYFKRRCDEPRRDEFDAWGTSDWYFEFDDEGRPLRQVEEYQNGIVVKYDTTPYRVYFYSHEPDEPAHVHVDRDDRTAKFWLAPVALGRAFGFSARELTQIETLIQANRKFLLESWNEYFGT